ncbi:DUF805 domain-containing protein [Asticcacaulis benevestitus]|uniref:DUF805 domain-containing protein n=1 Tax=Asticcacaulis benevestitus DSM 16100 = ATCC BAA-896 TaxID=1121022 RepID=V4NUL4_9CAUL|nr:DUF805 domain-containing protein [Asticcacaulis benevestitus]ESQ85522.1 hypothetical protein ABENE_18625 [Asticcacaulis benevestitus DSM 16100 = ATCC BAA-896]
MAQHRYLVGANALFSPSGRINRLQFALNFWMFQIIYLLILLGVDMLPDAVSDELMSKLDQPVTWLTMVLTVLLYYAMFCLMAMRLHDIGLTAWLALVLFAGIAPNLIGVFGGPALAANEDLMINLSNLSTLGNLAVLIAGLLLTFWPGMAGANPYGQSPNEITLPSCEISDR